MILKNLQANSQVIRVGGSLMIKDLREKVKMYMQLYVFVDIVKKDSPLCESSRESLSLMRSFLWQAIAAGAASAA